MVILVTLFLLRGPMLDHFACLERGIVPDPYLAAEWRAAKEKWSGLR